MNINIFKYKIINVSLIRCLMLTITTIVTPTLIFAAENGLYGVTTVTGTAVVAPMASDMTNALSLMGDGGNPTPTPTPSAVTSTVTSVYNAVVTASDDVVANNS